MTPRYFVQGFRGESNRMLCEKLATWLSLTKTPSAVTVYRDLCLMRYAITDSVAPFSPSKTNVEQTASAPGCVNTGRNVAI